MTRAKGCMKALQLLVVTLFVSHMSYAGVYVSYDSTRPTFEQELASAQLETQKAQTDAILRSTQSTEYLFDSLVQFSNAQQERNAQATDTIVQQRLLLDKQRVLNAQEQNELIREKRYMTEEHLLATEMLNQKELAITKSFQEKQLQLALADQKRTNEFLAKQELTQAEILAMQKQVADSQSTVLEYRIRQSAPTNVIVASKDANNFQQGIDPNTTKAIKGFSYTQDGEGLINLNEFIRTILPDDWFFVPANGSGNDKTKIVIGSDWISIINQLAIAHPHLQFYMDSHNNRLIVSNIGNKRNAANYDPHRTWYVDPNKSLRQNMEYFAKEANWNLIWKAGSTDYTISAGVVIDADFAGVDGVINQVLQTTLDQKTPLRADWGTNAVEINFYGEDLK